MTRKPVQPPERGDRLFTPLAADYSAARPRYPAVIFETFKSKLTASGGDTPPLVLDVAAGVPAVRAPHQHVDLHVHETGQQRDVAELDLARIPGWLVGVQRRKAVALDHDHGRRAHPPRLDVDPAVGAQHDRVLGHGVGSSTRSR